LSHKVIGVMNRVTKLKGVLDLGDEFQTLLFEPAGT
jgi:hypothetical protein